MISILLNFLFLSHLILILASGGAFLLRKFSKLMKPEDELRLNYLLLMLVWILPILSLRGTSDFEWKPFAKIYAAKTYRDFEKFSAPEKSFPVMLVAKGETALPSLLKTLGAVVSISVLVGLFFFLRDIYRLRWLLRTSHVVRRIGKVHICVHDRLSIPFSAWFGNSWVLLPVEMISKNSQWKVSVLHELQHHRQRDTQWIYVFGALKVFLFLNPFVWIWEKVLSEVQELTCDQNLVRPTGLRPAKIARREYARQLIEIAEFAVEREERLACAAGLAFQSGQPFIKRRIEFMFKERKNRNWFFGFLSVVFLSGLTLTAFAGKSLVVDRRISMNQAEKMLVSARKSTEFPLVLNDLVFKELNRYLGTEQGRDFINDSINRMESYRPMIQAKIKKYGVPEELMAVALIESGYQNLPQKENKAWGAGLWMFIESTARRFGLRVDSRVDERLIEEKETEAAFRYLLSNQLLFQDWLAAILAYNMGENAVLEAMSELQTKDVWSLVRAGKEGDKSYLARFMATLLILKNPEILN